MLSELDLLSGSSGNKARAFSDMESCLCMCFTLLDPSRRAGDVVTMTLYAQLRPLQMRCVETARNIEEECIPNYQRFIFSRFNAKVPLHLMAWGRGAPAGHRCLQHCVAWIFFAK